MQGNAEDIIHGKTDQPKSGNTSKVMVGSVNASPDQSIINHVDESIMTNDFDQQFRDTPGRRDNSLKQNTRMSFGGSKKPSIDKVAREMMVEGRDKGII